MKKLANFAIAAALTATFILSPIQTGKANAATSKAEEYVNQAVYWAGALKWQISIEYKKDVSYPDMKVFNATKDNILKAKSEFNTLPADQRTQLEAKLRDKAEIHYTRAIAYIDAISSGKKLKAQAELFTSSYNAHPSTDETEKAYHDLTYRIKHTANQLYKVYGSTTREAILKEYKLPAESARNAASNTITAKMAIDQFRTTAIESRTSELQASVEEKINKVTDTNTRLLLLHKLQTGENQLPPNIEKFKRDFQKLGFKFNSDTTAVYTGVGMTVGLLNRGTYWQLRSNNFNSNYYSIFKKSIAVVWGEDIAWKSMKYLDYAIIMPDNAYTTPNIRTFVTDDTLVVYIYMPRAQ
ncbi:hypothetical protein [Bacillus sp. FJAT-27445]|uniref:hypothetical protein n=1 Tax=Bacillus sp. FJAT-27445 TaxID=1679166 RepID=UPI0007443D38|nr:hypothetical protein [Bacillus sp. FJAT-27445]